VSKPSIADLEKIDQQAAPPTWTWWMAQNLDDNLADLDVGRELGVSEYVLICEMRNALPALLRLARAAKEQGVCTHTFGSIYELDFGGDSPRHTPDCNGCELQAALDAFEWGEDASLKP
jgi:hypothetical protein